LIIDIGKLLEQGRRQVFNTINSILLKSYLEVGKKIIEFEQDGKMRAEYGKKLLSYLSKDLKQAYGKGFSRSNLQYMRLFYICYPDLPDASGKLTWSHIVELLGVSDNLARGFYEKQCIKEKWSTRELNRQINYLFQNINFIYRKKKIWKRKYGNYWKNNLYEQNLHFTSYWIQLDIVKTSNLLNIKQINFEK
jgi:hypothetical protein